MKAAPFAYHRPTDLGSALDLLDHYGADCKILAGGVSLAPVMNMRLARPAHLIDIGRLTGLAGLQVTKGHLHVGALVRHYRMIEEPLIERYLPLLAEAGKQVGHTAIRSRGTVGGSIAHADPAAEWPVCALALDAQIHLQSAQQSRSLPASDFFLSYYTTLMEPNELLTGIVIPLPAPGTGWAFREFARRPGDFALVSACVLLRIEGGKVAFARIALGGVDAVPFRPSGAEAMLLEQPPSADLFRAVAERAAAEIDPEADLHASIAYRRHLTRELILEGLNIALSRCGGYGEVGK